MTIEVVTANDEVVSVRLVRGRPVADIDALRKYHREYYHANKQECVCVSTARASSPARVHW